MRLQQEYYWSGLAVRVPPECTSGLQIENHHAEYRFADGVPTRVGFADKLPQKWVC